ncbi:MAG TPA: LytR C-terminal domain-containing protein [Pedococcus sp.]|nr:LytR C-terminal domain-containing protein [Pedococcus sp.]
MSPTREDRRSLSAITTLVLLGVLVVFALVGWRTVTAPGPWSGASGPTADDCVSGLAKGDLVRTTDITVSVYNAGTRSGLAGRTQEQLAARGFLTGDLGNAPDDLGDVRRVTVLAASPSDPAAMLVARQFGKGTRVQKYADDLGSGVEVVVGDRYDGLSKAPRRMRAQADGSGC